MFARVQTTAVSPQQLSRELGRLVRHVARLQEGDVFGVAAATELTFSQLRALCVLETADRELALTELAPRLGLSPAATGRALDALHERGLVDRLPDPADRRIKRLALTDAGRETAHGVMSARGEALLRFAESLDDGERERLSQALAPVLARTGAPACGAEVAR
jgi:DNA-binding MarR family transcriptional regulator